MYGGVTNGARNFLNCEFVSIVNYKLAWMAYLPFYDANPLPIHSGVATVFELLHENVSKSFWRGGEEEVI